MFRAVFKVMYLLFFGLFFLNGSFSCGRLTYFLINGSYAPFLAYAVGISVGVIVLAYAYAKFFNDKNMLFFVKESLFTLIYSFFLIAAFDGGSLLFCYAYEYVSGENPLLMYEKALNLTYYFDDLYRLYLKGVEKERLLWAERASVYGTISSTLFISSIGKQTLSYSLYPEAMPFYFSYSNFFISLINILLGTISVQRILIYLITNGLFDVVFVAGVVLRLLPGFREAGALLLALYFSFAYLFVMLYAIMEKPFSELLDNIENICTELEIRSGLSNAPHPYGCGGYYGFLTRALVVFFSLWMPSLSLGVSFQAASSFKKVFEMEV